VLIFLHSVAAEGEDTQVLPEAADFAFLGKVVGPEGVVFLVEYHKIQ
jgi:hypothetical protein